MMSPPCAAAPAPKNCETKATSATITRQEQQAQVPQSHMTHLSMRTLVRGTINYPSSQPKGAERQSEAMHSHAPTCTQSRPQHPCGCRIPTAPQYQRSPSGSSTNQTFSCNHWASSADRPSCSVMGNTLEQTMCGIAYNHFS